MQTKQRKICQQNRMDITNKKKQNKQKPNQRKTENIFKVKSIDSNVSIFDKMRV